MSDRIVIKPAVQQQFDCFLRQGRILFFSAPCGFGKTALAGALLAGKSVLALTADERGVRLPERTQDWEVLLIDDFQYLQEDAGQKTLCGVVREHPDRRFVFLSRGVPPGWLSAFSYTGLMTVLDTDALLLDREEIRSLLRMYDVSVSERDLTAIQKTTLGYPLAVCIVAKRMAAGAGFTQELVTQAYQELFRYFDAAIYRRYDLTIRRFLLEMAPFDSFDAELARVVSGNNAASAQLDWIQRNTTMLCYDGVHTFHFWPVFREFLLWETDREYSGQMRRAVFCRGGLYYELRDDYPHALECYVRGGSHAKVSELLIRNAGLHPSMGHYLEMARYYRSLPEREILASPALMQGMSMLCALSGDYDGSEKWYDALKQLAAACGKGDAAGREAKSRLVWLDISLPQRGIKDLAQTIPAVCRLLTQKEITLPPLGVTACQPSILNGGKDFSDWTKTDNAMFRSLCTQVVEILGKDGVGLSDCALAESTFETGGDISAQMLLLLSQLNEIRNKGTPDIEFAAVGLLARNQLDEGHPQDAQRLLESLRKRFADAKLRRFLPNLDAMLCRLALHTGDTDAADAWYRQNAPRAVLETDILRRYQYVTQAMTELTQGRPDAALLTLAPLEPFYAACQRHIDTIQLRVLQAIALFRLKNADWRQKLSEALEIAAEYRYIRTISVFGAAVLPLLETLQWSGDEAWHKRLICAVRMQAAFYPWFLATGLAPGEELTATEKQVLRLLCADMSNAEIGATLDIRLPTVKTHVSRILKKLGVSRRSEAKTAAQKLWLIP